MAAPRVVAVGLGPAGADLLTAATRQALDQVPHRYLRTARHPAAGVASWTAVFDDVYDAAPSLEAVYARIADAVVEAAETHGEVLYAVPGSPRVGERTVDLLAEAAAAGRLRLEVVPALSFLDLAWARLGVDPVALGVRVVDGHRFGVEAAGERGPLLVAQCDSPAVLSDVKLAFGDPPPPSAVVLQRLGLPDESVRTVSWSQLDREVAPDHLTTLWLPEAAPPVAAELAGFAELVRRLRAECPWDREQTHHSLTRHLLEETYEVLEAIDAVGDEAPGGDVDPAAYADLEEELGDLLFQVVFHATLGAEAGQFTLADVARGIHDKLVRRHPHVFGEVAVSGAGDVVRNWEQIKREEKGRTSVFDGIPRHLPALLYAAKALRKAATLGVEPAAASAAASDADVGEALLALVERARRAGVDAEAALRGATARFVASAQAREAG